MKIENPFESGHIRNYILFYVGIVIIMVLFFISSTLFNEVEIVEPKVFNTTSHIQIDNIPQPIKKKEEKTSSPFKLLEKAY